MALRQGPETLRFMASATIQAWPPPLSPRTQADLSSLAGPGHFPGWFSASFQGCPTLLY